MKKYNLIMKLNHWVMAILIISLIFVGWFMDTFGDSLSYKGDLYNIHKAFGVLALLLVFFRIFVRLLSKLPDAPSQFKTYEKFLSKVTHMTIYLLMLLVPLSGYIMSDAGGHAINFFGYVMPDLLDNKSLAKIAHEIHGIAPYVLLSLILLHIFAVIKHYIFDKVNILSRMI